MLTIVAHQGESAYLLAEDRDTGRVLDLKRAILFPPFAIQSILIRGYWEEYTGPQDILPKLLEGVARIESLADLEKSYIFPP